MGVVWLAIHSGPGGFNKLVVVKELRQSVAADESTLKMFLSEARIAARLSHPNIVQTNEVGESEGLYFIAMEFLDGKGYDRLRKRTLRSGSTVALAIELYIVLETLQALRYAHEYRDFDGALMPIVHRDVSPPNILLTFDGHVKLVDFGIAKATASSASEETDIGVIKGKLRYMAPEQLHGGAMTDPRADIFALGIILAEVITKERFWSDSSETTVFSSLLSGGIPGVRNRAKGAPARIVEICEKALAFKKEDRYSSAAAMADDIEAFLEAEPAMRATASDLGELLDKEFAADRASMRSVVKAELNNRHTVSATSSGSVLMGDAEPSRSSLELSPKTSLFEAVKATRAVRGNRMLAIGSGVLVMVLGSWAILDARGHRAQPVGAMASTGAVAPVVAPTAAPALAPEARTVAVNLRAKPASAQVLLDGRPVDNPYVARVPLDRGAHVIAFRADKFRGRTETRTLDQDVTLDVTLESETRTAPAHVAAPGWSPQPPPAPSRSSTPPPDTTVRQPPPPVATATPGRVFREDL